MPSASAFSPFQISHAFLQRFTSATNFTHQAPLFISVRNYTHLPPVFISVRNFTNPAPVFVSVRNFACLVPVVLLVSATKLWAEENFRMYLMIFLYTLPEQTSCTLPHIISGLWRKFLLHILCCFHFTSSYMLWEISKHDVGDIHQWRSFHTRIRVNRSVASKVVKGSQKRDGGLKKQHSFYLRLKESVLDMNSSTENTEGYCCHIAVKAVSSAVSRRACHANRSKHFAKVGRIM